MTNSKIDQKKRIGIVRFDHLPPCVDRANEYRAGERAALFEKIEGAMQATSAELDKEGRTLRLQADRAVVD